eukprot:4802670-Pleurochrysis_carterae.AAC.4
MCFSFAQASLRRALARGSAAAARGESDDRAAASVAYTSHSNEMIEAFVASMEGAAVRRTCPNLSRLTQTCLAAALLV